jgi:hypothetical protein
LCLLGLCFNLQKTKHSFRIINLKCPYCKFDIRHFGVRKDGKKIHICNHCKMEFDIVKCPKCNKRMKTLYERIGSKSQFYPIGYICKSCKKVILN